MKNKTSKSDFIMLCTEILMLLNQCELHIGKILVNTNSKATSNETLFMPGHFCRSFAIIEDQTPRTKLLLRALVTS